MRIIFLIIFTIVLTSCSSGFSRAIQNYNGPKNVQETNYCSVKIWYDMEQVYKNRRYLQEHNYKELGYTCWSAKPVQLMKGVLHIIIIIIIPHLMLIQIIIHLHMVM